MFVLQSRLRRLIYVIIFEILAIALSTFLLMVLSGGSSSDSLPVAITVSVIAVIWNYVFNTLFETWERRLGGLVRTLKVRLMHAGGFELGLLFFTVPIYMLWYRVGFVEAVMMEIALLIFFLIYTFVFTWLFDLVFVLPRYAGNHEKL